MTIMNILSSDEEEMAKSKQKTPKNLATPRVELNQQNIVRSSQKSKTKKKKAAKSETSFSAKGSETNKEKYFHVEKSIAASFRSTDATSFSFLSLCGRTKSGDQENEDEQFEYSDESSSSDETEVRGQQLKNTPCSAAVTDNYTPAPVGTPVTTLKESMPPSDRSFFFTNDDPRLSDGVKYFHRKLSEEELWKKWSSGFKKDVRNLFVTRPKRSFKMASHQREDTPKKMKFHDENLDK